jgi:hypothetical protein
MVQTLDIPGLDRSLLENVIQNIDYNKTILNYYECYFQEFELERNNTQRKKDKLAFCNKFWTLDKYELQKIKDVKRQNLCQDKFCANCKKVKQASRMAKYIPELEKYQDNLYHLVLTVPNCRGPDLKETQKEMCKAFRSLIRLLEGSRKVKGLDFQSWGYQGAVRSFEVTFKGDTYHPHFHVGLVASPGLLSKKKTKNLYSYDFKNGIPELRRLFSKEEILIQKIWYLLINGIKVTKQSIDELETGYSCIMDKFPAEDYAELFKYMTKEKDQTGQVLSYDQFKTLYVGLHRVKQIQGYGCLYQIDDEIDLEVFEEKWQGWLESIRQKESPVEVWQTPQELLLDTEYTIINRKAYFAFLRSIISESE